MLQHPFPRGGSSLLPVRAGAVKRHITGLALVLVAFVTAVVATGLTGERDASAQVVPLNLRVTGVSQAAAVTANSLTAFSALFPETTLVDPVTWPGTFDGLAALRLAASNPDSAGVMFTTRILGEPELDDLMSFKVAEGGNGGIHAVVRGPSYERDTPELVRADDFVNFLFTPAGQQALQDAGFTPLAELPSEQAILDRDIDLNGEIGLPDVSAIALHWDVDGPYGGWVRYDIDNDGNIGLGDISAIALHWDETAFIPPSLAEVTGFIAGSETSVSELFWLTADVKAVFKVENPDVTYPPVSIGNTSNAYIIEHLTGTTGPGDADFVTVSREMEQAERDAAALNGVEVFPSAGGLEIGHQALVLVTSNDVDWLDCLTLDELNQVWMAGSTVSDWDDVRVGFPAVSLDLYGPDAASDRDNFRFFTEVVNGASLSSRTDYAQYFYEDDMADALAAATGGLGYMTYEGYLQHSDDVQLLAVDSGPGCVTPSHTSIRNGSYEPLARPLFLYANGQALQQSPLFMFVFKYLSAAPELAPYWRLTPLADSEYLAQASLVSEAIED